MCDACGRRYGCWRHDGALAKRGKLAAGGGEQRKVLVPPAASHRAVQKRRPVEKLKTRALREHLERLIFGRLSAQAGELPGEGWEEAE